MDVHLEATVNGKKVYYLRVGKNNQVIMTDNKENSQPLQKHLVPGIITKLLNQYEEVKDVAIE